jgi:hypothetical protein
MPDLTPAPTTSPETVADEPFADEPFAGVTVADEPFAGVTVVDKTVADEPLGDEAAGFSPPQWFSARQRWAWPLGFALAGVVLFFVYLHIAKRHGFGADGAVLEQMAWDMLHGNPLMRGWTFADISFYTIEIPELAVVEWLHGGISPGVLSAVEALNLTVLVLLVAFLAKGRATGREGLVRAVVAGGILVAPVAHSNSTLMLGNPDHLATQIFVLAAWLIVDRARPRWWVPVAVAAVLAWARMSDSIVLLEAEIPLLVVCVVRIYRRGGALRDQWYELSLGAAAIAAELIAQLALRTIRAMGGFNAYPLQETFAPVSQLSTHIGVTVESSLLLYGADFSGLPLKGNLALLTAAVHLIGVALAVTAVVYALRRFPSNDLMPQIVTMMLVTSVLAYTLLGRAASAVGGAHDVWPVLPAGAVLAGMLLFKSPIPGRLLAVVAAGLALYLGLLAVYAVQVPNNPNQRPLATWLVDHHLRFGLSNYYAGALITVDGDNRTTIAPVKRKGSRLVLSPWESTTSWYNPALYDATFFVATPLLGCPPGDAARWVTAAIRAFGQPNQTYSVDGEQVLVWNHNLLDTSLPQVPMGRPSAC